MPDSFFGEVVFTALSALEGSQEGVISRAEKEGFGEPLKVVNRVDPEGNMRLGMINKVPGFEDCQSWKAVAGRAGKEYYFLVLGVGSVALSLVNPTLAPVAALMGLVATKNSKILQGAPNGTLEQMKGVAEEFLKSKR